MKRILLVTGASSDIGDGLISGIGRKFDVLLCHYGRSAERIESLSGLFGDKIIPLQADFRSPEDVEKMAAKILASGFPPTHFVHLPALENSNQQFAKTCWDEYDAQLTVQLRASHALSKAFLPVMAKARFGRVVFMLTENVVRNPVGKFAVPYTVAKFALLGLLKCLSAEYSSKGITINGISPSMIETNFVARLPELSRQLNAQNSPLKRNLAVADVLPTLEFLLSDEASMINGQNIAVMGGN
jgi:3-oxoacyl-[acyl-carrier protein] reductase